jgi:hypothetical protein
MKDTGVMWESFLPDIAVDFAKGLVAGGASLALQAVAPRLLRALKRLHVRWFARKPVQEKPDDKAIALTASHEAEPIDGASAGEGSHAQ